MKEVVLIIAPHADDETLGCGGVILKHKNENDKIHYLLVTETEDNQIISGTNSKKRNDQIKSMKNFYKFNSFHRLGLIATMIDNIPINDIISKISDIIRKVKPTIIYLPFPGDIHSDHFVVFQAASACTKWFRASSLHTILVYETLSETNFILNPTIQIFKPNLFVDITNFIDSKIKACKIFKSEIGKHPFPRSLESIKALSMLRGSESGFKAAEAFMILKKIEK